MENSPHIELVAIDSIQVGQRLRPVGDITQLIESISQIGLLQPIVLSENRQLIAGFNRLETCRQLGHERIPAIVLKLTEIHTKLAEVDENLIRNELSVLERAEQYLYRKQLYEALNPEVRWGGKRGNQHSGGIIRAVAKSSFCQDAAQKTRQSSRTIHRLVAIARDLSHEARQLIRTTRFAESKMELLRLAKVPQELQEDVARALANGGVRTVTEARAVVERENRLKEPCYFPLEGDDYRLLLGDFRKRGREVEANSVQLILTDPPYFRDCLPLFSDLSSFGKRVLKPGGSLLVMVGHYFLPAILDALGSQLRFHWFITCVMLGQNRYIQSRRVRSASKLFLWFQKGLYQGQTVRDVIKSGGPDKRFHQWGQSEAEFAHLVECLTQPGDVVVDPFLGGGVTAAVSLRLGRKFVGVDVDSSSIDMTKRRTAEILETTGNQGFSRYQVCRTSENSLMTASSLI